MQIDLRHQYFYHKWILWKKPKSFLRKYMILNVIPMLFWQHKQSSVWLYCAHVATEVSDTNSSDVKHMKVKSNEWQNTDCRKWDLCLGFGGILGKTTIYRSVWESYADDASLLQFNSEQFCLHLSSQFSVFSLNLKKNWNVGRKASCITC